MLDLQLLRQAEEESKETPEEAKVSLCRGAGGWTPWGRMWWNKQGRVQGLRCQILWKGWIGRRTNSFELCLRGPLVEPTLAHGLQLDRSERRTKKERDDHGVPPHKTTKSLP